ncbi:MAG: nicotinate phosphoribosyltransferase [Elusimicrobia bacterium GWA2_69_24]|nr:MAG: nicotinate phosphoribosyltransferase [Elusimicrobia bacterium GWA2_69_24]HBL17270.1 nicotinate phosphoribosyltransferase [Elusimicrobiota bacterium]
MTDGASPALLTDLYQLTMAQGYWKAGRDRHEAVFHHYFRADPFRGGYALACGLGPAAGFLERFRFAPDDLDYLAGLAGTEGGPLFDPGFLEVLRGFRPQLDLDAVPEGTVVFAPEPLLRVRGPLLECQLFETALLNIVNFQTLIATKASRIVLAAGGAPVLEFGLRRAQGFDGGLSASRAAYAGGCAGTSNVLAGKLLGIPVRGTHAHSWVMAFSGEDEAFETWARTSTGGCVLLVDTYDTLEGVRRAVAAGLRLKARGRRLAGIRLDSGDLAALSRAAREMLDAAGLADCLITASSDLDEHAIARLRAQGAPIAVWGVGTRLVTGHDQPALGGVYKLSALRPPDGDWEDKMKTADDAAKASYPGMLQVRRFRAGGKPLRDVIYDIREPLSGAGEDLLVPVFRRSERVRREEDLTAIRERALAQLRELPEQFRRLAGPRQFPVELDAPLHARRERLRGGREARMQ